MGKLILTGIFVCLFTATPSLGAETLTAVIDDVTASARCLGSTLILKVDRLEPAEGFHPGELFADVPSARRCVGTLDELRRQRALTISLHSLFVARYQDHGPVEYHRLSGVMGRLRFEGEVERRVGAMP